MRKLEQPATAPRNPLSWNGAESCIVKPVVLYTGRTTVEPAPFALTQLASSP
jgi:hypothetical protein